MNLPMKTLLAALIPLGMTQCISMAPGREDMVTKIVFVRPVNTDDGRAVSAHVVFPGIPRVEYHPAPEGRQPLVAPDDKPDVPAAWHAERFKDGALRVTWTGRRSGRETPFLTEEGFHPVEVPRDKIKVIDGRGKVDSPMEPFILPMGGNTAYLPKEQRRTP